MNYEAALETYRQKRASLQNDLRALPQEQWTTSVEGSFNSLETLAHLAHMEGLYILEIEKRPESKWAERSPKTNFFFRQACKTMAKARPIPAPKSFHPTVSVETIEEGIELWEASANRIESLLADIPDSQTAMKHPFFGRMSRKDVLDLLTVHSDYHRQRLPLAAKSE